ncbi:MAG: 4Fe-4S binding protein [Syntrophomonadaceae bacterium]|nr:4Fe-4S binding protein [Syntrophomonadaceae bacterium]
MKEILFISGKGGTGKTSLTASFIHLAGNCIACDYDVDASNLPILLKPENVLTCAFSAGYGARIDGESCVSCGLCAVNCRFEAISPDFQVIPLACEGCGFCAKVCPVQAISMHPRSSGHWFQGRFAEGQTMFYADLRPGEENSGKLVAQVKTAARKTAAIDQCSLIIADGPPGIGCAVISSMVEVDLVVLVTEPSRSGFHDLERVYQLMQLRGIKGIVIINKYDLNPVIGREIEDWAAENGIALAGKIPFSTLIAESIAEAQIPAVHPEIREMLFPVWENIKEQLRLV